VIRARSFLLLVGIVGFARVGSAGERAPVPTEDKVVSVVVSGDRSTTAGVEVVVRELVARLPVALEWSQASGIDPGQVLAERAPDARVVARAWMDLSDPKRARIYVANASSGRFLVRVVPLRDGYDEVAREVLGHIIESAVDAFLAGRDVGVTREMAEREVGHAPDSAPPLVPPSPPPRPKAEVSEATGIGFALSYQATDVGGFKATMHGPAVAFLAAFPTGQKLRVSTSATLHYRVPMHWDSPSVGARFDGGTARLGAGVESDISRRASIRGQLGFGVDVAHLEPYVEAGSTATAGAPLWVTSAIASASLTLEAQLSSRVRWLFGVGCDVDLSGPFYFVANDAGTGSTTVLSPWIVRPVVAIGVVFRPGDPTIDQAR
jgi:hypothetical protein